MIVASASFCTRIEAGLTAGAGGIGSNVFIRRKIFVCRADGRSADSRTPVRCVCLWTFEREAARGALAPTPTHTVEVFEFGDVRTHSSMFEK